MKQYYEYAMEVSEEDIEQIFDEIKAARETIFEAYSKLGKIGVIRLRRVEEEPEPPSGFGAI